MLKKSDASEIEKISSSTENPQLNMILSSIYEENTEGYLWVCEEEGSYFLWDKGNIVFYLFGEEPTSECLADLSSLFCDEIEKKADEEGLSHFKVTNLTSISERSVRTIFDDRELKSFRKNFYEYRREDIGKYQSSVEGLRVADIDKQFLKNTSLRNLAKVINEIKWMWPSFDKYYENGFGKAGLLDNEIVCWCTSEYVSEGFCGIGIETLERYRDRGIATKTALEFVKYCLINDIIPYWECYRSNEPSVKLAERIGFDKIDEYKVLVGKF